MHEEETPYQVIPVQSREWTPEEQDIVAEGMEKTAKTVPNIYGNNATFILTKHDKPVGIFCLFPDEENKAAELGIRLWDTRFPYKLMVMLMITFFTHYDTATASVYASNQPIKRILQRAGFTYLGSYKERNLETNASKTVERYALTRKIFLNVVGNGIRELEVA